jgi:Sulfotransferase family
MLQSTVRSNEELTLSQSGPPSNVPDVLIHLHIPKTGGTSLNSIVQHGFRTDEVLGITVFGGPETEQRDGLGLVRDEYFRQQLRSYTPNELQRIRYITGHLPFGLHRALNRPAKYFTVIRHPVDRVISDFFFDLESDEPIRANGKSMTFEEFASSDDVRSRNYQVRVLSGSPELNANGFPVERRHLEAAKSNIDDCFLAVAPLQRMTELALLIRRIYRWPMRRLMTEYKLKTRNRPRTHEISAQMVKIIETCNAYDIELYEWVQKRFAMQCQSFEPQLSRDLRFFKIVSGLLNDAGQVLPWQLRKRLAQVLFYA